MCRQTRNNGIRHLFSVTCAVAVFSAEQGKLASSLCRLDVYCLQEHMQLSKHVSQVTLDCLPLQHKRSDVHEYVLTLTTFVISVSNERLLLFDSVWYFLGGLHGI